jgi:hypothetical protein
MADKKTTSGKKKSSLFVRCAKREGGFPSDLLGRINARAEELEMDRDDFVTELLRQEMERWEIVQKEVKKWWESRIKPKS